MKNNYVTAANHGWLVVMWVLSLALSAQAQSSQPPVLQWQRVVEGGIDFNSRARVAKSTTSEFGVANGTTFTHLTASGAVKSSGSIGGSPLSGVAAALDGGFFVLSGSESGYSLLLLRRNENGTAAGGMFILPVGNSSSDRYQGEELIQTNGGRGRFAFLSFANHFQTGFKPRVSVSQFSESGLQVGHGEPSPEPVTPGSAPSGTDIYKRLGLPDGGYIQVGATGDLLRRPWPELAYAARFDMNGNRVWSREYSSFPAIFTDVILNPDGSGSFIVVANTGAAYTILSNGDLAPGTVNPASSPSRNRLAAIASDGSGQPFYVVLSESFAGGRDFLLRGYNQQNQVVWTKTLGGSADDSPQTMIATGDGYLLVGTTTSTDGDVQGKQGTALATWVVKLSKTATSFALTQPTYNCQTGAIVFNTTGGDGSPITYNAPGVSRTNGTDNFGTVEPGLRNDPKPITITATQNGNTVSYTFDFGAFCGGTQPPTGGPLTLLAPTYDCTTGAFRFNTSGGNGTLIEYQAAPGITGWTTNPNQFVDQESRTANDLKPFTLMARQSGVTVTYVWDLRAVCPNPPAVNALTLLAPTYDCTTGAFRFNTSGGNGTLIEYRAAPGITDWTTNPNQFVDRDSRTANDVKPFTLMARQSGVLVSYVWDLKAACGRARLGVGEPVAELSVVVLGNPASDAATVEVRGAEGKPLRMRLLDLRGRLVESRLVEQAGVVEQQRFDLHQSGSGLLLLRVTSDSQSKTIKIVKQ